MARPIRLVLLTRSPSSDAVLLGALGAGGLTVEARRVEGFDALAVAIGAESADAVLCEDPYEAMPGERVLEVLRSLDPDLPVLAVLDEPDANRSVELMRAGASDCLSLPFLPRLAPALAREVAARNQRRAQHGAQSEARRLAAIVSSAHYAIMSQSLDGLFWTFNAGAERLFGYPPDEIIGQPTAMLLPPELGQEAVALRERVARGEYVPPFDTVRIHQSGRLLDVSLSLSPVRDERGRVCGISAIAVDIADRKVAERENALLRSIVDSSPDVIGATRFDGRPVYLNPAGRALMGISDLSLASDAIVGAMSQGDQSNFSELLLPLLSAGRTLSGEIELVHQGTGELTPLEWRAFPIPSLDGAPPSMFAGTARDVSARKRAAEDLRHTTELLTAVTDGTPDAVYVKDGTGRYLLCNPAAASLFGTTVDGVRGRRDSDFFSPPEAEEIGRRDRLVMQSGQTQTVEEALMIEGTRHVFLTTKGPYRNEEGVVDGVIGVSRDITQRKQAEEALLLRDRAMRAATQGFLITDASLPNNPIIYASPSVELVTGYAPAELMGTTGVFLHGADTDPQELARLREATRHGEPCTVELLNYPKDGTPFFNQLSVSPVRDDDGRVTHFVGVQSDVTQRRQLEEKVRQSQKMEAIGLLAGGVAHDFNNLLTVINGYSGMLLKMLPAPDPARELVEEIERAGALSAGLTRQLLAFSRKSAIAPRTLSLNDVVTETDRMLRRLVRENVYVATSLASDLWPVVIDPGQIEQVLINLVVNARDAMPDGGDLSIETRNQSVDEAYVAAHAGAHVGPYVVLRVSDRGVGMSPEIRARLFEPFFTTKELGHGTGLGLATVYGIVQQSGGHIVVESELGVGTLFEILLPRAARSDVEREAAQVAYEARTGGETILVVEDEGAVRALVSRILARAGYRVVVATDGSDALRQAEALEGPLDLLLTDVVMPGLGGRAVADRVSALRPGIKVIFMSGYVDDAVVRAGVLLEGVNFLQKPFTLDGLTSKIREVLDA